MIPSFSAYHVFAAHLGGSDYRCSAILDDASFENLMDMMHWKMPYNLCAYHRADRKQIAELSTLTAAPELRVPLDFLLTSHPPLTMNLKEVSQSHYSSLKFRIIYGQIDQWLCL